MNESSRGEPDTEEDGDELHEPDAVTGPQHVHILQDVRDGHQTGSSQKPQPCRRHINSGNKSNSTDVNS